MQGKCLFLGTGASMGVPLIGCHCAVCSSHSPLNKRLRPSVLLTMGSKRLLIDAGPDFRQQALLHGIDDLDGVLLTHGHFDHIAGLDELRIFYFRHHKRICCLLSEDTFTEVKMRYHYMLKALDHKASVCAQIDFLPLQGDFGERIFEGILVRYLSYFQAKMKVTGYRIGNLSYVTDIRDYDEKVLKSLEGTDLLILSALRKTPTPVHFSIDEGIAFARKVRAKHTYLIHLAHDIDHEEVERELPSDVHLSYDGLCLEFTL